MALNLRSLPSSRSALNQSHKIQHAVQSSLAGIEYKLQEQLTAYGRRDKEDKFGVSSTTKLGSNGALTPVRQDELQNHTFMHTIFCQTATPNIGLSETYDGDHLFSFDFSESTRVPRLPEFAAWAQKSDDISTILFDKTFCLMLAEQVGPKLEGKIPVSRGIPIAEVFTLKPLELGKPNTLVCYISNLFPPTLTVNWQHNSVPVEGTGPFISAVDGLSFQAFSYLNFTPAAYDLYSCSVTHEIDSYTAIAYWVPRNALPSDLLENVLCGVAFALGVLGIIVGLILIIYFQRPCAGG
ncbi:PREDICTED: HLA class II histocompatibility antigen, DM alpha chain [Condylura cristata]|uniref:HLA class II histocompatibility antigen, DM alpha chain n=1 Tax=Condylura cristata TaxID=143302 RepID=UPI000642A101|nr:PREDICTED: HLA class II histocompatibility antigen, DM alpha chain [Condylura cristata]